MHVLRWFAILHCLIALLTLAAEAAEPSTQVVILVGPSNHPPGTHEVAAGGRLLKHCLENASNLPDVQVDLLDAWPEQAEVLDKASTIILLGDTFPLQRMPDTQNTLQQLGRQMERGCGIVCIHYATGLRAEDVASDGEHPLLHWLGGYFATRCEHHQSVAKIYEAATITSAAPAHPIWRGCQSFTLHDEPYINNFFGKQGNQLAANVTPLAISQLPPEAPQAEIVAWCVERQDGGRGLGIVMPHFYRNWQVEDLRRLILNGIVWTAHRPVPEPGIQTTLPALATFAPEAVEPLPRK